MKAAYVAALLGNATNLYRRLERQHKVKYNKALFTTRPLGRNRGLLM